MSPTQRERWRIHREHCSRWQCWGLDNCLRCAKDVRAATQYIGEWLILYEGGSSSTDALIAAVDALQP